MRQSLGAQDTWRAIKDGGYSKTNKRLNTGMAPTCDWMIKTVKVNNLYLNSLGRINNRSDEGLTLETSAFLPFTMANLRFRPSC